MSFWGNICVFVTFLISATANIAIQVENPTGAAVLPNSTVQLICAATTSDLSASFLWSAPNGADVKFVSSNNTASIISITPTTELGYGTYTCGAYISQNDIRLSTVIISLPGPPQVVKGPEDQFVIEASGRVDVFSCEIHYITDYTVTWLFINSEQNAIDITTNTTRYTKTISDKFVNNNDIQLARLTIHNVNFNDRGTYSCIATSVYGNDSAAANLTVHVIPTLVGKKITSPRATLLNQPVAIFCELRGYPVPNISWEQNGMELSRSSEIIIFDFTPKLVMKSGNLDYASSQYFGSISDIVITNGLDMNVFNTGDILGKVGVLYLTSVMRKDSNNYSCTARNSLPQTMSVVTTSEQVRLLVIEPPDPPTHVILVDSGPTYLSLTWIVPYDGNKPLLHFPIYIGNSGPPSSTLMLLRDLRTNTLPAPISGVYFVNITDENRILPHTEYFARVVACNDVGCSDQSEDSNHVLTDQYLSSPPRDFTVSHTTNSSVILRWTVPSSSRGLITHYRVRYNGLKDYDSNFLDYGMRVFDSTNAYSIEESMWLVELRNLTPGTTYEISVAAVNGARQNNGVGLESTQVTTTTSSIPPPVPSEPPTVILDDVTFGPRAIGFQFANFSEINGLIIFYQVIVVMGSETVTLENLQNPDVILSSGNHALKGYNASFCNTNLKTISGYITAEFKHDRVPPKNIFVVGKNDRNSINSPNDLTMYVNGPLCYNKPYVFYIRAFTDEDMPTAPVSQNLKSGMYTASKPTPPVRRSTPDSNHIVGEVIGGIFGVIGALIIAAATIIGVVFAYKIAVKKMEEDSKWRKKYWRRNT